MGGSTTLAYWQLALLAVGPAAITAAVATLSPWLSERMKRESERKTMRIAKFEELVAALSEHQHWLEMVRSIRVFGGGGSSASAGVTPMARIEALTSAHFRQFRDLVTVLNQTAIDYERWMVEAGMKRLKNEQGYDEGFAEVFEPYAAARQAMLQRLRDYAAREFA